MMTALDTDWAASTLLFCAHTLPAHRLPLVQENGNLASELPESLCHLLSLLPIFMMMIEWHIFWNNFEVQSIW